MTRFLTKLMRFGSVWLKGPGQSSAWISFDSPAVHMKGCIYTTGLLCGHWGYIDPYLYAPNVLKQTSVHT